MTRSAYPVIHNGTVFGGHSSQIIHLNRLGKFVEISKETRSKFKKLVKTLQGKSRFLIVMQDNPDPDSIVTTVALCKLANSLAGLKCSIVYGGTIGRGENT